MSEGTQLSAGEIEKRVVGAGAQGRRPLGIRAGELALFLIALRRPSTPI